MASVSHSVNPHTDTCPHCPDSCSSATTTILPGFSWGWPSTCPASFLLTIGPLDGPLLASSLSLISPIFPSPYSCGWLWIPTHACHTGEYCWNKSHIPTARLHSEVMTTGLQWALHAAPRASASCLLSFQIAAQCHPPPSQEMTLPQASLKEQVPRAVTAFLLPPPPCGPVVCSAPPWWLRPDTQRPHALPFQRPVLRLVCSGCSGSCSFSPSQGLESYCYLLSPQSTIPPLHL